MNISNSWIKIASLRCFMMLRREALLQCLFSQCGSYWQQALLGITGPLRYLMVCMAA